MSAKGMVHNYNNYNAVSIVMDSKVKLYKLIYTTPVSFRSEVTKIKDNNKTRLSELGLYIYIFLQTDQTHD